MSGIPVRDHRVCGEPVPSRDAKHPMYTPYMDWEHRIRTLERLMRDWNHVEKISVPRSRLMRLKGESLKRFDRCLRCGAQYFLIRWMKGEFDLP